MKRGKGFTLIELLVVIAIIGILAAMVFPVFARARESARKIVCLSNVKNLALAFQMYMMDYNGYFPWAATQDAEDYFAYPDGSLCNRAEKGNPYLREAVLLDEYVRNRDVYQCPSAKVSMGAQFILPPGTNGYWLNNYTVDHASWKADWDIMSPMPCYWPYPSGWGGTVTDSWLQGPAPVGSGKNSSSGGAFQQSIGFNDTPHYNNGMACIDDPVKFAVVGDVGCFSVFYCPASLALSDYQSFTAPEGIPPGCCGNADWDNCSWTQGCGLPYELQHKARTDSSYRRSLARHLGGVNVGFADGHAAWYPIDTVLTQADYAGNDSPAIEGLLLGCAWDPTMWQ
jgi:prepilin-type N-terminal cleavage/methylation domain-containing protein/prepilin-type processing-associated H-X9-DG protein